jgi:lipoprotein signal peptidase
VHRRELGAWRGVSPDLVAAREAARRTLGDTLRLELAHDRGAFLSLGAALPEPVRAHLFTWGVGLVVIGALVVALRAHTPLRTTIAAALAGAGGIGNLPAGEPSDDDRAGWSYLLP